MKINQFFISRSTRFFRERMETIYGWECINGSLIYDKEKPTIFMGMYNKDDILRLNYHEGLAIILWCGVDVLRNINNIPIKQNIKHLSCSHWISDELNKNNIQHRFEPICFEYIDYFQPTVLGNKVYCYSPNDYYGTHLLKEIEKDIKYELIHTTNSREFNLEELNNLYSQCFIGLRLRNINDGNSATVQGMSFKGIRTIWNGNNPLAIKWNIKEDVIQLIEEESEKIGTTQIELAKQAKDFYTNIINGSWLRSESWE